MASLIGTADRARDLAEGRDPGLELLSVLVIGEAYLALGETGAGEELLGVAEPFLLGGDVLAAPAEVLGMAGHSSIWVERFDRAEAVLARLVRTYRDASAVVSLIYPLAARAHLDLRRGRWSQAVAEADESRTLAEQTGQVGLTSFSLATQALVLAHLGREEETRAALAAAAAVIERMQAHAVRVYAVAAHGHLELSLGRIAEAAPALEPLVALAERLGQGEPALVMWRPDLIEALVRAGRGEEAAAQVAVLARQAQRDRRPLGPRGGAALPRAARRRRRLPGAVRGRARAPRRAADAVRAGPHAALLRRAAAPRQGARRRARAAARRAGDVRAARRAGVGGAGGRRAAGHGRMRRAAGRRAPASA